MKAFVVKLLVFSGIASGIIAFLLFHIPTTHAFKKSLFFAIIDKNNLLQNTQEPRIIFVGGSNLSFGLNSQAIKDSLHLNPINMGIHASLGLRFMLSDVLAYVRANDIIIVSAEYYQFFGDIADGRLELLSTLVDVDPELFRLLDIKQAIVQTRYIPIYIQSKINRLIKEQKSEDDDKIGVYDRKSFNQYGDTYIHWEMSKEDFSPQHIQGKLNYGIIKKLKKFQAEIEKRNAKMYISFPPLQDLSYDQSISAIKSIESIFRENGFTVLSCPERFRLGDSLFFNTPSHLNKKGVDVRTQLVTEDLQMILK